MSDGIQVMLIEDNPDYRDAIQLALEAEEGMHLACQFGTSEMAISHLKGLADGDQPHVILLDLRLPGMDGLDALPLILNAANIARVIVLTQSDREQDVLHAIKSGAAGYLLKSATVDQLTDGIRVVHSGGAPLDPGVAKFILESLQPAGKNKGGSPLSDREHQVLSLIAQGLVKKEIAKRLEIGYTTVDTHVGRIYAKLKVNNAPAAVNEAHRRNLFAKPSEATEDQQDS